MDPFKVAGEVKKPGEGGLHRAGRRDHSPNSSAGWFDGNRIGLARMLTRGAHQRPLRIFLLYCYALLARTRGSLHSASCLLLVSSATTGARCVVLAGDSLSG